ncbi:hypothetical protein [Streptomyces misionensis]|uniref:hypothetical protein n=1 Tax=Streptomyces misionensis TaxID=67331 RepID=UPI00396C0A92
MSGVIAVDPDPTARERALTHGVNLGSISGELPLTRAAEAVERLENKTGDPIRLILRP